MSFIKLAALAILLACSTVPAFARGGSLTLPGNVGKGWARIPTGGNQPESPPASFRSSRPQDPTSQHEPRMVWPR